MREHNRKGTSQTDMDKYFEKLTPSEWTEHQQIERELNELVSKGFSERSAIVFVTTAIAIRKIMPEATIEGIFEAALLAGLKTVLDATLAETGCAQPRAPRKKRSGVRLVT